MNWNQTEASLCSAAEAANSRRLGEQRSRVPRCSKPIPQTQSNHVGAAIHIVEQAEDPRAMVDAQEPAPMLGLGQGKLCLDRDVVEEVGRAGIRVKRLFQARIAARQGEAITERQRGPQDMVPRQVQPAKQDQAVQFLVVLLPKPGAQPSFPLPAIRIGRLREHLAVRGGDQRGVLEGYRLGDQDLFHQRLVRVSTGVDAHGPLLGPGAGRCHDDSRTPAKVYEELQQLTNENHQRA